MAELCLSECLLQARTGKYDTYFVFVNLKRPEKTLSLYRPAMIKLLFHLPRAFSTARSMEEAGTETDERQDVAVIQARKGGEVMLYAQMYEGHAFVFLRLFMEKVEGEGQPAGERQPTTFGVRFSSADSVETLTDFVNRYKWHKVVGVDATDAQK